MDAIDLLTTQHGEVGALFEKLDQETDEARWRELLGRLADRLTMHAALEEEIFYPALATVLDGATMADHARDEHRKMTELLEGLRDPHARKHPCHARLHELRRTVEHHVAEEENDMMPRAQRLGTAALRDLAFRMEERMHVGDVTRGRGLAGEHTAHA